MTFINMDIVVFKDSILMVSIVLKVQFLLQVHCRFWRELRSAKIVLAFTGDTPFDCMVLEKEEE